MSPPPPAAPLILSVFPSFAVGGAQVRFVTLANRLGPAFRHAVIAMDGAVECGARLAPGIDVVYPEVEIRPGGTLGNAWHFRAALSRIRPDALVTYNWGAIEWALANAVRPLVRQVHVEDGFGPEETITQIPRRVLMRRVVLRRCTVVVPSKTLLRVATDLWRLPTARLRYVPNGVDLARFRPPDTAKPAGSALVIGTVASLRAEKNIARLLRAFRLLPPAPEVQLVVVGDGPERILLETLAAELGLAGQVRFTGQVDDPSSLYRTLDVFALPSDTEQMPLSILEAMSARLPVAATDVGDIRNMVAEENLPFVVPPEDAALADALRRLLADAALRRSVGAANRAKAEREFDEQAMVEAYRHLFDGRAMARPCEASSP